MSNTSLIIEERSRDIGDFLVGRLLPFRKKRMVGPFIFIDHMGPIETGEGHHFDIDQHPHAGLSTLTYLFEGEIVHEDGTGSYQRITPGSVNWMTAGKGVTHTERTPPDLRDGRKLRMHGYQIWVALPREKEEMDPEFHHVAAGELPKWSEDETDFILVAGEAFGRHSPVPVHSNLFMIDVQNRQESLLDLAGQVKGEIGICIVKGAIEACGEKVEAGNMLVSKAEDSCKVKLAAGSHLLLFGGEPFGEERYIDWNFVSSDKEKLRTLKEAWISRTFPMMDQDRTYIPYPGH